MSHIHGIRGAIQASENSVAAIKSATQSLLRAMMDDNGLTVDDIISAFFTMTIDLNADYPAAAARAMGWTAVPLLDAQELEVPGGLPRVIRVLLHVRSTRVRDQIQHIYIGAAEALRPDLHNPA
jgi:chorismate mutase